MDFNNQPNEEIDLPDGRKIFLSRSVAVVMQVYCIIADDLMPKVLLNRRGPGCPDEVGKYSLNCGYLDWDENAGDACKREVWEETGLDLDKFVKQAFKVPYNPFNSFVDSNPIPWNVISNPSDDGRQNVCLHYGLIGLFKSFSDVPAFEVSDGGEANEVDDVKWVPYVEASNMSLAFNHHVRINQFMSMIQNKFAPIIRQANIDLSKVKKNGVNLSNLDG